MEKLTIFSEMIVFSQYAMQVVMSFMMLVVILVIFPRAAVAARRINEVLDTQPGLKDGSLIHPDNGQKGEVEFRNVCFRYPDADGDVLSNISFKAHKGETVALIGPPDAERVRLSPDSPFFTTLPRVRFWWTGWM